MIILLYFLAMKHYLVKNRSFQFSSWYWLHIMIHSVWYWLYIMSCIMHIVVASTFRVITPPLSEIWKENPVMCCSTSKKLFNLNVVFTKKASKLGGKPVVHSYAVRLISRKVSGFLVVSSTVERYLRQITDNNLLIILVQLIIFWLY